MEEESLRHNVIMILLDVLLTSEQPITLKELVSKLGHYSDYNTFSKGLRRLTGRGVGGLPGILILLWQYPSLFTVTSGKVWLTSSLELVADEPDVLFQSGVAVDFYEFQLKRLGAYSVPISRLFEMQSQASKYVKQMTGQSVTQLKQFLKSHSNVFAFTSDDCVVLCEHLSRAEINGHTITRIDAPIELDEEVYNNTRIIVNTYHGRQIIEQIFQTTSVVSVDLEGVNLGSVCGSITLVQLAFLPKNLMHDKTNGVTGEATGGTASPRVYPRIYIFDVYSNPDLVDFCLKRLLESNKIKKVFHGCEDDSYALHRDYGVVLNNFLDTQAAHTVISAISNGQQTEAIGLNSLYDRYGGFGHNPLKAVVKKRYIGNSQYWCYRPLTEEMIYYAAYDVYVLLGIYLKMYSFISQIKGPHEELLEELNKKSAFGRIWAEQDRHPRPSFYQPRRRPFGQRRASNSNNNNYSPNYRYNKTKSNR